MIRIAKVLLATSLGCALYAQTAGNQPTTPPANPDRAAAYYNFAMGRVYAELAGAYGNRGDYLNKAIEHYRQALKLDPSAGFLFEELADLYIQAGQLRSAISEAEDLLKQNPDNLDARRILGRIYTRMIGDPQQNKINETMLRNAIEQYQKITEKDPKDIESWLSLGRLYKASNNSVEAEKAYSKALALDRNNEDALTGLAIVYSDTGDTAKAIDKLKALTDRNPNARTLAALASAYEQMRDFKNAADVFQRVLAEEPKNARVKRALAQDLLYSDQYDAALKLYTQLAAEDPKDAQTQLRISEIYRQKRDFAQARAALAKAKQLDSDSLEVRYDEVNLLDAEGKTAEAITALKGIIQETAKQNYSASEKSNRSMLLERLGIMLRNAGQYQPAVDAFRQIADLETDAGPRVAVQIIETWRAAHDMPRALQEADAALKKFPQERMVKMVHASVLADTGKVDAAAAEVKTLLKGDRDRETQLALAQIWDKGKRYKEMQQALDEAEKLSTNSQDKETVYFMRGAMFERMKNPAAAEAQFRKVLELNPENAGALNYLGYMFADRNERLDEAQKLIARALELDPGNGAYLDSLAWVYYRQNKLPDAENLLIQALDKIGNDPTVHDHLGDVYFKQGKTREAITQWQASLKEYDASPASERDPAEVAKVRGKLEQAKVRLAKETGGR